MIIINIDDLVTRKSHQNDVVFCIVKIEGNVAYLRGAVIRLVADAPLEDLSICHESPIVHLPPLINYNNELRNQFISGLVLHIDGDDMYLKKAIDAYRQYGVPAIGYHIDEKDLANKISSLLHKHHPDVLVITGHDALEGKEKLDINSYRNSLFFVNAVKEAREYEPNKDSLVIIAGACQSYYEALLKVGANFASSPTRDNIHLLDPVIIASEIAHTHVNIYVAVKEILNHTISHRLGGIDTKGVARRFFVGG